MLVFRFATIAIFDSAAFKTAVTDHDAMGDAYKLNICQHAAKYMRQIMDFSIPINGTGRKYREALLDRYTSDIAQLKKKLGI